MKTAVSRFVSKGKAILLGHRDPQESGAVLAVDETARVVRHEPPTNFLWLDRPSYDTAIRDRLGKGRVTPEEADLLRSWAEDGYVILKGCIDDSLIDAMLRDVGRAWDERWHVSLDDLTNGKNTFIDESDAGARDRPHKLNDLYLYSEAVRKVFLHERIVRFAQLVFEAEPVGVNSLVFTYGSQQPTHVDHVYMTPDPTRRLIASWVALEDVRPDAGPLEVWPGSHRLPPFRFSRNANPFHYVPEEQGQHSEYLSSQQHRFAHERFMAKKGDVLLWHAMLAHGGTPIDTPSQTRKSMACHYFSRECYGQSTDGLKRHGSAWFVKKHLVDPD